MFRTVFGDEAYETEFRSRVRQIVSRRRTVDDEPGRETRPTMTELSADGYFEPVSSQCWRWSVEMTADQLARLFGTFSDWTADEVHAVRTAAEECGVPVTEHYRSVLHLLRRAGPAPGP